jgi:hypothetical protein
VNTLWTQLLLVGAGVAAISGIGLFLRGLWTAGRSLYRIEETLNTVPALQRKIEHLERVVEELSEKVEALTQLLGATDPERVKHAARVLARHRQEGHA